MSFQLFTKLNYVGGRVQVLGGDKGYSIPKWAHEHAKYT